MSTSARLVVGDGADEVRRSLGPTSWAALEVLASRAVEVDGRHIVTASVRSVADALDVAKNTAHRAMRRLVEAGLVEPIQQRSGDGRFLAGAYRLTVAPDVLQVATDDPAPCAPPSRHPRTRRSHPHSDRGTQLDLLASCD